MLSAPVNQEVLEKGATHDLFLAKKKKAKKAPTPKVQPKGGKKK